MSTTIYQKQHISSTSFHSNTEWVSYQIELSHNITGRFLSVYNLSHKNPLTPKRWPVFQSYHFKFFHFATKPSVQSWNPWTIQRRQRLVAARLRTSSVKRFKPTPKYIANGVARNQIYLTISTSLLVVRFIPSYVTSIGVSLRRDSRCSWGQIYTKDLGFAKVTILIAILR